MLDSNGRDFDLRSTGPTRDLRRDSRPSEAMLDTEGEIPAGYRLIPRLLRNLDA